MVTSLWDSPLKCYKQHSWHYLAGQLHVWQNYFHSNWIFIIGQTQGWGYKGAVGGKVCRRSQALTAERVWNAKARLLPCALRGAKEPAWSHQQSGHQKQSDKTSSKNISRLVQHHPALHTHHELVSVCDDRSIKSAAVLKPKTSCAISFAENDNCFLSFLWGFVMQRGFNTSSFLRGGGTVQADWNLMLLLTSASPAVIVPLFIITAAVEEHGWVAQTPCLTLSTEPSRLL